MSSFFTFAKNDDKFIPIISGDDGGVGGGGDKILLNHSQFTPLYNDKNNDKKTMERNETETTLLNVYVISIYLVGLYIFYRIL